LWKTRGYKELGGACGDRNGKFIHILGPVYPQEHAAWETAQELMWKRGGKAEGAHDD